MGLRRRNRVTPEFQMSSMTDIIFLLLIFFMLTSTLVSPNALELVLPGKSKSEAISKSKRITISIDQSREFTFGSNRRVKLAALKATMENQLETARPDKVTVVIDEKKGAIADDLVTVMSICNDLQIPVVYQTSK